MTITCLTLGWAVSYRGQKNLEKLNLLPKNFTSTVFLWWESLTFLIN